MRGGNKYGARKSGCRNGHTHDSAREATRCNELHLMLRGGEIEDLKLQEQFWFAIDGQQLKHDNGRRVGVKIDFTFTDRFSGRRIAEDSKGMVVRDWPLRKAVFKALYPDVLLREV